MKTETELKETWCPFARQGIVEGIAVNRDCRDEITESCLCIGLACSQCVDGGAVIEDGPWEKDKTPEGDGWYLKRIYTTDNSTAGQRWLRETGERHAYCGQNTGEAMRQEIIGAVNIIENAINRINPN